MLASNSIVDPCAVMSALVEVRATQRNSKSDAHSECDARSGLQ